MSSLIEVLIFDTDSLINLIERFNDLVLNSKKLLSALFSFELSKTSLNMFSSNATKSLIIEYF